MDFFQNLIDGLDLSLNSVDFSNPMSQHVSTGVVEKDEAKIGRGSSDSLGTNNSVYSDAVEVSIAIFFIKFEKKKHF